jgi:hypothetical protein
MSDNTPIQPKDKSQYRWFRDGGYTGMPHFMATYGLKLSNDDDLEEAKAIIARMREEDQKQWEAEHGNAGTTAGLKRRMLITTVEESNTAN